MQKLVIEVNKKKDTISPEIYGHFAEHLGRCIYGGIYVGEDSDIPQNHGMRIDVVEALKALDIPLLRWPGGCFADEYHWKDGIGPKGKRKKMLNTHWGGIIEDNSFGTHEYMELCKQLNCKTYINGNLGSGTVQEMSEWVEYMTLDGTSPMAQLRHDNGRKDPWIVDIFGVGNESWGCGGNMNPDFYANEYRRYQTYVRSYDNTKHIKKVCCGPSDDDYDWTEKVLKTCFNHSSPSSHGFMDYLSLHYYVLLHGFNHKGSAVNFTKIDWYNMLQKALYMDTLITQHSTRMDVYDPEKKIGLAVDEWGSWYDVEIGHNPGFLYQQNTMRDALIAALTLSIFNKHSDRVKMACLAQMVNVLQSVILTDGKEMIKTPTYYIFHMFRYHQGGTLLQSTLLDVPIIGEGEFKVPFIMESVSEKNGIITISLINLSATEDASLQIVLKGKKSYKVIDSKILQGKMHDHNTFSSPCVVQEEDFQVAIKREDDFIIQIPQRSVIVLRLA